MKPGRRCRHMWWCLFEAWAPPETLFTFLQPPDVTTFKVSFFNHIKPWMRKCSPPQLDIKISRSTCPHLTCLTCFFPGSGNEAELDGRAFFSGWAATSPLTTTPSHQTLQCQHTPNTKLYNAKHTKHQTLQCQTHQTPNTTMPTHNTHQTLQCKTHQYKEAMLHRGLYTCQMDTCCALQRRGGVEQRASLLCRVKPSRMCCKVECCMYIVV